MLLRKKYIVKINAIRCSIIQVKSLETVYVNVLDLDMFILYGWYFDKKFALTIRVLPKCRVVFGAIVKIYFLRELKNVLLAFLEEISIRESTRRATVYDTVIKHGTCNKLKRNTHSVRCLAANPFALLPRGTPSYRWAAGVHY